MVGARNQRPAMPRRLVSAGGADWPSSGSGPVDHGLRPASEQTGKGLLGCGPPSCATVRLSGSGTAVRGERLEIHEVHVASTPCRHRGSHWLLGQRTCFALGSWPLSLASCLKRRTTLTGNPKAGRRLAPSGSPGFCSSPRCRRMATRSEERGCGRRRYSSNCARGTFT